MEAVGGIPCRSNPAATPLVILVISFDVNKSKLPNSLSDATTRVSGQCVVEIADEIVAIVFWQTHKCSSHHDEFHFVYTVTQLL